MGEPSNARIRQQVEKWRDELLDLTGNNQLLRFRARKSTFEIEAPEAPEIVERLMKGRSRSWSFFLPPAEPEAQPPEGAAASPDSSAPDEEFAPRRASDELQTNKKTTKDVLSGCAQLSRRAGQEFMDKGIWVLYLGVGMLRWSDPADRSDTEQDSPLLLVPVALEPEEGRDGWRLVVGEDEVVVNPALSLKLSSELSIELPDLEDDDNIDVPAYLDAVTKAVSGHLTWSVQPRVVLATFSFHKEAMYRDLRDNLDRIIEHPIVEALASDPGTEPPEGRDLAFDPTPDAMLDTVVPPELAMTILDADASQRQCIAAALDGRSFVMDGPPGTGKSQTIANVIAELIARGKTVLFVSEKAAALDVVHKRLDEAGISDFALELHSHKATRKAVAAALGESLHRRPRADPLLAPSDLARAEKKRAALTSYVDALNAPVDALGDRTLHELLGRISKLQGLPQAPVADQRITSVGDLDEVVQLGIRLSACWGVVERGEDFVWAGAAAPAWGAAVEQRVHAALTGIEGELEALQEIAVAAAADLLLPSPVGPAAAKTLRDLVVHLTARPGPVPEAWLLSADCGPLDRSAHRLAQLIEARNESLLAAQAIVGDQWAAFQPKPEEVEKVKPRLENFGSPDDLRLADVRRAAGEARTVSANLDELTKRSTELAVALGMRATHLAENDAEALRRLAELAGETAAPMESWLVADGAIEEARAVIDQVRPLLASEQEARAAASGYAEAVIDLDLAGLQGRFASEYRGLKKLSAAYRADRAQLAAAAPDLKGKTAIQRLPEALAWQEARRAVEADADRWHTSLGECWAGVETDLKDVDARLRVAEEAMQLAADRIVDRGRLARAITTADAQELRRLGREASDIAARLHSTTPADLRPICEQPMEAAAAELADLALALDGAGDLISLLPTPAAVTLREAFVVHTAVADANRLSAVFAEDTEIAELLGPEWARLDIKPEDLLAACAWAIHVTKLASSITQASASRLAAAHIDAAPIDAAVDRWNAALDSLLLEFETNRRATVAADLEGRFVDAAERMQRLRDTKGDIELWADYRAVRETVEGLGLQKALDFCTEHAVRVDQVADVLLRSALEATADALLGERSEALGSLRAPDRDRLVREFRELDRKVIANAAHRVIQQANGRRPSRVMGVAAIIANEAQKKKRHMPVARLLAETAEVAQAIKPCFMMSPLSVSQYLSPRMRFDVVIFDEASQVKPCDAVNALYRGSAMIVAGDENQLPPTNFFERAAEDGDAWEPEEFADVESVLGQAKRSGTFTSLSLTWHYRSRHEDLIAFSNHSFYGGRLITFPSAAETAPDLGVTSMVVDGVYMRGGSKHNQVEAEAVAERVFSHAEEGGRSIGVVAFSEPQASLIEDVIQSDRRYRNRKYAAVLSADRLDGLFVKNLENVQGDERDIIIFSVGYGPDEHGKLTMNFGPVTHEGGWRRLNVAITRARRRVEIVSSFRPAALAGSANPGVEALRRYMEFAERGISAIAVADAVDAGGSPESPFEESVLDVLESWGYVVRAQVGTAGYRVDLAVQDPNDPGRFAIGIECDGAMYHSSRVARDRDRLRQQVLEGLGWKLHRIWGPSWYRDRGGAEQRLRTAIENALKPKASAPVLQLAPDPVRLDFEELDSSAPPPWCDTYVVGNLPRTAGKHELADDRAVGPLRDAVLAIIKAEGPIVEDLIAKRVLSAWEATGTERRRRAIARTLKMMSDGQSIELGDGAFTRPGQADGRVRIPSDDPRTRREVEEVPDCELGAAILRLVEDARVIEEDEALRATARIFGWRRTGATINASLQRILERLIADERISRADGLLRPQYEPTEQSA